MTLVEQEFIPGKIGEPGAWKRTWYADHEADIAADHDTESAPGSLILAIDTGNVFVKNSQKKWQKVGSAEVIS